MYFQELWTKEIRDHYAMHSFKERKDGRWEYLYSAQSAREISESLDKDSVWDLSKSVNCPTLILRGESSPVFTKDHLDKLGKNIPHATKVNLPNSSHTPPLENPIELAREIDKLIK